MAVIRTPMFRVSYPAIFEHETNPNGESTGKYSLVMVFDKEAQKTPEFKALKKNMQDALKEKFGDKAKSVFKSMSHPPIRPVKDEDEEVFGPGAVRAKASTKRRLRVISAKNGAEIFDASDFYPGCYAIAEVEAFGYDKVSKGVSFGLRNLIKMKDGESLGGSAAKPEEAFSDILGDEFGDDNDDDGDDDGDGDGDDGDDW